MLMKNEVCLILLYLYQKKTFKIFSPYKRTKCLTGPETQRHFSWLEHKSPTKLCPRHHTQMMHFSSGHCGGAVID